MPIAQKSAPAKAAPAKAAPAKSVLDRSPAPGAGATAAKESVVMVEITRLENGTIKGEPVVAEEREIKLFRTNTAYASAQIEYRKNLGNFEGVKIGVMVGLPCYVEEFDSAMGQALDKAKAKLDEAMEQYGIDMTGTTVEEGVAEEGAVEEQTDQTEVGEGEEGGLTLEDIIGYDEDGLKQLAELNPDFSVNPGDYAEVEDLRQVLIQAALGEDVLQSYLATLPGAGEATDEAAEESATYAEEDLQKATIAELKQVFADWDLGDFPKGPPPVAKKAAIKKILEAQS